MDNPSRIAHLEGLLDEARQQNTVTRKSAREMKVALDGKVSEWTRVANRHSRHKAMLRQAGDRLVEAMKRQDAQSLDLAMCEWNRVIKLVSEESRSEIVSNR